MENKTSIIQIKADEIKRKIIFNEVVQALLKNNPLIESVNIKSAGTNIWDIEKTPQIPTKQGDIVKGTMSINRQHWLTIKIGKDITIKKIQPSPTSVQNGKYEIYNDFYYVIRTKDKEIKIPSYDREDFYKLILAIEHKYDNKNINAKLLKDLFEIADKYNNEELKNKLYKYYEQNNGSDYGLMLRLKEYTKA